MNIDRVLKVAIYVGQDFKALLRQYSKWKPFMMVSMNFLLLWNKYFRKRLLWHFLYRSKSALCLLQRFWHIDKNIVDEVELFRKSCNLIRGYSWSIFSTVRWNALWFEFHYLKCYHHYKNAPLFIRRVTKGRGS